MIKFLTGLTVGTIIGFWLCLIILWSGLSPRALMVNCHFNDGIMAIPLETSSNIEGLAFQETIHATCTALKAFRECKYLRRNYPAAKQKGTALLRSGIRIIRTYGPPGTCAFTIPGLTRRVYLSESSFDNPEVCPPLKETIFHEMLHNAGMPDHKPGVFIMDDPIYQTQFACFGG